MTRSGAEYIEGLRDGRRVFIDGVVVSDVTTHPAFSAAVQAIAGNFDLASDPSNRELMTYSSPATGAPVNRSWTIPRSMEDLRLRRLALERAAESTLGLIGRGPEHMAGFFAGFASAPDVFAKGGDEYAENIVNFYEYARDNDIFLSYAIVAPQIDRSRPGHAQEDPTLYAGIKEEREDGIVITGAQMLATGGAISDYVFVSAGNPLPEGDEAYAMSVVVPVGAKGVRLHARRSYAEGATSRFDYPLSTRFDESDSWIVFDDVFVPWKHVFACRNRDVCREQFYSTPSHILGNAQAQVRFAVKLRFLAGLAKNVAELHGNGSLPPVQAALGEIAGYAATVQGMVLAQEYGHVTDQNGVVHPGPAELYASMVFQPRTYANITYAIRELCGGSVIALPSSAADFENVEAAADIRRFLISPVKRADEKVQFLKLVWDMIGSEFASRHYQYEMFYAGPSFVVKGQMYRAYDFDAAQNLVDAALAATSLEPDEVPVGSV